jgi:K+-sensing histidine kinase KdpD
MTNEWILPKGFVANSVGAVGGSIVGGITALMGGPWWSLPVCAAAGLLIGFLLPAWNSKVDASAPLNMALRVCRSLPLWDRVAMSALLVVTATAIYLGLKDLHILTAFYLFLLPIVLAQLIFGARCGVTTAFVSLVAIYYFAIPPRNSFAVQGVREVGLICAFAVLALITSATLAVLTDVSGDERQPQQ